MSDSFLIGTQLLVTAVLPVIVVSVTWRAATGRLPRSQTVGIRTPATLASEKAWRAGHRAALPVMSLLVLIAVAADVAARGGVSGMLTMSMWASVSVLVCVVAAGIAARAARKISE
ncbi:Predicted integral membrane protein [Mycobacteroides abscessus subsp. abscessus]|uniref:SdpI family protein n=1 Tax=Mycobacteroides abscessus TaxID=36809 RepID=UPI000927675B|nr:SdpI family protein [Mycobacteroides abscessus]SIH24835.1 Predicted integral membrane protein [Mycobacteroides abscessus subsp. abscessus]